MHIFLIYLFIVLILRNQFYLEIESKQMGIGVNRVYWLLISKCKFDTHVASDISFIIRKQENMFWKPEIVWTSGFSIETAYCYVLCVQLSWPLQSLGSQCHLFCLPVFLSFFCFLSLISHLGHSHRTIVNVCRNCQIILNFNRSCQYTIAVHTQTHT